MKVSATFGTMELSCTVKLGVETVRLFSTGHWQLLNHEVPMRVHLFLAALVTLTPTLAFAASETPPEGPPWKRDFGEAQREAMKAGKPIFIYSTKTY